MSEASPGLTWLCTPYAVETMPAGPVGERTPLNGSQPRQRSAMRWWAAGALALLILVGMSFSSSLLEPGIDTGLATIALAERTGEGAASRSAQGSGSNAFVAAAGSGSRGGDEGGVLDAGGDEGAGEGDGEGDGSGGGEVGAPATTQESDMVALGGAGSNFGGDGDSKGTGEGGGEGDGGGDGEGEGDGEGDGEGGAPAPAPTVRTPHEVAARSAHGGTASRHSHGAERARCCSSREVGRSPADFRTFGFSLSWYPILQPGGEYPILRPVGEYPIL